jgi:N-acetylmuramoyl-L-alanine amidase
LLLIVGLLGGFATAKSGGSLPRLKKITLKKGYVEFVFDRALSKDSIIFRHLYKKGRYKNIYDIKGIFLRGIKRYKLRTVDAMRVAQYDKETIRVVFEDERPIKTKKEIAGRRLLIHLKSGSNQKMSRPKRSKTIVIDPGHGGKDSGAVGYRRKKEKDLVFSLSKRLAAVLRQRGYRVHLTRRGDYKVPLKSRPVYANKVNADLFVSIHANAAPSKKRWRSMHGLETFFLSPSANKRAKEVAAKENMVDLKRMEYSTKQIYLDFINRQKILLSNRLAIDIQRNILSKVRTRYPLVDGGVRPGPFYVLVGAQMPAVIVEVGYITNPVESRRLHDPHYQKLLVEGLADGIESYFRKNK